VGLRAVVAILAGLALAGCGGTAKEPSSAEPAAPVTLETDAIPELSVRERDLAARDVAADSFRPDELAAVLADAGYVAGVEREFYGRSDRFDRVVVRTLVFGSVAGAQAYVDWLEAHPDEFLGISKAEPPPAFGEDGFAFSVVPCGTCKKQLPTMLIVWRHGPTVAFLLAAGRGADRARFDSLARLLDERITA
jgi:hypothetical protein